MRQKLKYFHWIHNFREPRNSNFQRITRNVARGISRRWDWEAEVARSGGGPKDINQRRPGDGSPLDAFLRYDRKLGGQHLRPFASARPIAAINAVYGWKGARTVRFGIRDSYCDWKLFRFSFGDRPWSPRLTRRSPESAITVIVIHLRKIRAQMYIQGVRINLCEFIVNVYFKHTTLYIS